MKKRLLSCILALMLAMCILTSCSGGEPSRTDGTTSSKPPATNQTNPSLDFAERLENAVLNETQSDVDFETKETHRYDSSSTMEKRSYARWIADLSDRENPKFFHSAQRNPNAEEPEALLFYDNGYLYVKDSKSQYRQPASLTQAASEISLNALSSLFGDRIAEIFQSADVTKNADGSQNAFLTLPLDEYAQSVLRYLGGFGIEASGTAYNDYPLSVTVTMSGNTLLSYRIEAVMQATRQGEIYPATYTVSAVCHEIGTDFSVPLPDETVRAEYPEAEPSIDTITAEEFLQRFEKSSEKANAALYTEMVTNAAAMYEFSNGSIVTVPMYGVTALDLSKPRAPKISVVETKDMMGLILKTEIYYKDDMYYLSSNGQRTVMSYPAEEYLANVEASAKEKEEAGISSIFLTEEMLAQAVFTVGADQSVRAFMQIDGKTQEKNIFYNINSLYNDDLSEMQNVTFLETEVSVTIDRFNYMRAYTLTVTVSAESNGKPAIMKYTIEYLYDYDENPREIDFPDDLDSWNSPKKDGNL
jgi:hypothetical protein